MKRSSHVRCTQWLVGAVLALGVFEACSNTSNDTVTPPAGPANLTITAVTTLDCQNVLLVSLDAENWTLLPPGRCGTTPQCGTIKVSLLETETGPVLAAQSAAVPDVQLDLTSLVAPLDPDAPSLSLVHFVKAELLDDALQPVLTSAGNQSSVVQALSVVPNSSCSSGQGGAGGTTSVSGGAGATEPSSSAGAAGVEAAASGGGAGGADAAGMEAAASGGGAGGADAASAGASGSP